MAAAGRSGPAAAKGGRSEEELGRPRHGAGKRKGGTTGGPREDPETDADAQRKEGSRREAHEPVPGRMVPHGQRLPTSISQGAPTVLQVILQDAQGALMPSSPHQVLAGSAGFSL